MYFVDNVNHIHLLGNEFLLALLDIPYINRYMAKMSKSLVLTDYNILNADASETDTDADRYLIKIESTESNFNMPEKIEFKSNDIFLKDKTTR